MTARAIRLQPTASHLRLIMPNDKDPSMPETLVPETDRNTQPPGADDAAAAQAGSTMLPPASPGPKLDADGLVVEPSTMPELLYNQLMRVHQAQVQRDRDLLDHDGKFAALVRSLVDGGADKVATKLEPRFLGIEREVSRAHQVASEALRVAQEAMNRVAALESELAKYKPAP